MSKFHVPQDISISDFIFLAFHSATGDLKRELFYSSTFSIHSLFYWESFLLSVKRADWVSLQPYTESWTSTSAFPTVSTLRHPGHSQPFSSRQWIWVYKDDTANTAWEMWTMFIIHLLLSYLYSWAEKNQRCVWNELWCMASPGTYHRAKEIASESLLLAGSTCGHKLQYWCTSTHSPHQDCSCMYLCDNFW